jgi:hypothetical protein
MTLERTAIIRAAIGLAQGFALYLLYQAFESRLWPATDPVVFAPLLTAGIFVPLIAVSGLCNMRMRTLAIWVAAAAALCAGLAIYDIFRDPNPAQGAFLYGSPRLIPTTQLWTALAAGLFILHSLIASGETDRKFVAGYPRYFDVSWKHGVQYVLTVFFVAVFWGLLWLGAEMFRLIKLEWLADLIKHRWFWIPVTTLAITSALHVTDVRAGLVRGARTLKLTLLSWLLPVMTAIAVVFVLSLPFTGLEPLWNTRRATFILLTSAAVLVFLINAAYQDGQPEASVAPVLRYSRLVAAAVLIPLVALAGYGLLLRIQQYGWTPRRITALACFVVLACYALGYVAAGAMSGTALRQLQITNVATAYVILAVLLAIFSPIADPARISVADQVSRLEAGRTPPDKFDYRFLRFGTGRYGRDALQELAARTAGPQGTVIAQRAGDALRSQGPYAGPPQPPSSAESRAASITVLQPAGQSVPEDFLKQDWATLPNRFALPRCLQTSMKNAKCFAILADLDGDNQPEILLFSQPAGQAAAFKRGDDGWTYLGSLQNYFCRGVMDALRAGEFTIVPPRFHEIEVAGNRLRVGYNCTPVIMPPVKAGPKPQRGGN